MVECCSRFACCVTALVNNAPSGVSFLMQGLRAAALCFSIQFVSLLPVGGHFLPACRGFAFVDFLTKQEAAAAAAAVAGTHLYGRRLVVEWAAAEEGLDELRAMTAARSRADDPGDAAPAPAAKRRKGGTA